ncbi:MAG: cytochrome P450 [Elainellaceae cyanobacterium]
MSDLVVFIPQLHPMPATASKLIPPGDLGLPFIGQTLQFLRDPDFAAKRHRQYGPIFKAQILGQRTIFLKGAEANTFVLTHENKYFQTKWPPSVEKLLGSLSLALQTGHVHMQRRKLMAQAFQPRALAGYVPAMSDICDRYAERWVEQETLTWYPELRNLTFDIAGKLLVGLDNAHKTPMGHLFEVWTQGLFSIPLRLPWTRFGKAYRCRDLLLQEIENLIRQRQQQDPIDGDALAILLQARDDEGNGLAIEELKDQLLLLLFAGHETLTSALASCCLLLAQYPKAQAIARTEQAPFKDQPLTADTLKQMPYLDQVLKEVLRFTAPVGGGFRTVLKTCEYDGFQFPEGWNVLYEIAQTHHDSELFRNPERFEPERFEAGRAEDKAKTFAHLPFGGGVRECLGKEFARLEIKIFVAKLLQSYQWELLPNQDLSLMTVPTPYPKDGLRVKFSKI